MFCRVHSDIVFMLTDDGSGFCGLLHFEILKGKFGKRIRYLVI
jgi:hypothetical protein